MRVLLLYPPITHQGVYSKDFRRLTGQETSAYPPLGLMYLQAMLKRETDYDTRLVDMTFPGPWVEDFEKHLSDYAPDVVGITTYTLCFYDVMDLVRRIKAVFPEVKIVLGGPHLSLYPDETMSHAEVDYAIVGDGEVPFLELLRHIERDATDFSLVPSLCWKRGGELMKNTIAKVDKDLDALPFPCRDDLASEGYFNPFFSEHRFATIATSRGCPFSCTFCDVTDKIFRARSTANILDEMEGLTEQGIRSFFLVDDLFNITAARVEEFCDEVLARGMDIKWIFRGRIDQITPEMLDKCKRAGCVHIIFGVEDYTDEGMKLIRKKITTAKAFRIFGLVREKGIKSTANFILGFPHHKTMDDLLGLSGFVKRLRPDYLQIGILIPFPGSQIYADGVAKGVIDPARWTDYIKNPTEVFEMPLWEEHLTLDQLTEGYEKVLKRFYFSPRQLMDRVLELRNFRQFMVYAKVGWATLMTGKREAERPVHPEELVPTTPGRDRYYEMIGLYDRMKGKTVADIGCGTGFFSERFARAGATVYAVDASEGNVAEAERFAEGLDMTPMVGDAHALPFEDESLDAVFCSCVVEHFDDPEQFFGEVHRVLKPDGQFLLTVDIRPKLTYWLYKLTFAFDHFHGSDHPMVHKHTAISDDLCLEFIDLKKMESVLFQHWESHEGEPICGLNFNLVHGSLVIVNRLYQLLTGGKLEDNYSEQVKVIERPIFKVYRKLLPVIRWLVHPKVLTHDAIYYYQTLTKRRS